MSANGSGFYSRVPGKESLMLKGLSRESLRLHRERAHEPVQIPIVRPHPCVLTEK